MIVKKIKIKKEKKVVQIDVETWKKLMLTLLIENRTVNDVIHSLVENYFESSEYTAVEEK